MKYLILCSFLCACASKTLPTSDFSNLKLGTWTQTNEMKSDGVILIPQWHLSPGATPQPGAKVPQESNQRAIFTQLSSWIGAHTVDALLAEGCEGAIESQANKKFNGWSIDDLKAELNQKKSIDAILAPIAFKVDAQYSKDILVTCGDDEKLIKENQLALSNLRGLAGFKLRIENPSMYEADRQSYIKTASEILHLPKGSSKNLVVEKLNSEIKKAIEQFETSIHQRDERFIAKASELHGIKVIVIGALHIEDLKSQLSRKNIPFSIWTPVGIDDQDAQLIEQIKAKLKG